MAEYYGDGLIRSSSGRITYAPDGLTTSNGEQKSHWPFLNTDPNEPSGFQHVSSEGEQIPRQERLNSELSGATTAHSRRSSATQARDEKEQGYEKEDKKEGQQDVNPINLDKTTSQDPTSRAGLPFGLTTGLNQNNYSAEADVEKQRIRNEKANDNGEDKDPNLVEWSGPDDSANPMKWPTWKKWMITVTTGIMTFTVTFASSVFSTATSATAEEFGVSPEVMVLGTSLFVLGFAFGPIVWGPFSELYGRKIPLFVGFFIFAIFQIPVAVAQNLETIFICRFLGGFFASSCLAIVGGLLADMFDPINRALAITAFASATFIGPVAGPIVGGFITMSYLGWRWTSYITAIMAFPIGLVGFMIIPETFSAVILSRRAKKIRFQTKNWAVHAKMDEQQVNLKDIAQKYLLRPFTMLAMEPILLLVTLYMGFIYGFLYLCFEAYPIAFQEERGWNAGVGALPFSAIAVGVLVGAVIIVVTTKTRFKRKYEESGKIVPEERLIPMIIGGVLLPIGMFMFAWTSNPNILWVPQVIAGGFIGAGVLLIFLQGLNYIIDCYAMNANSAIAANTFFRSWLGAGFPMFATGMFYNLGVPWAMSLLGFLTAALFPVPILFFIYGEKIRKLSKFSPST